MYVYAPVLEDTRPPAGLIWWAGDSITAGVRSTDDGGFRSRLAANEIAAGKVQTSGRGSLADGPSTVSGQAFSRLHEGHSGLKIEDLTALAPALPTNQARVLALLIGANNVSDGNTGAQLAALTSTCIDALLAACPHAAVVLMTLTPTDDDTKNVKVAAYNVALVSMVAARADAYRFTVVDVYSAFVADPTYKTTLLFSDGVHPRNAGYQLIADLLYAAIYP